MAKANNLSHQIKAWANKGSEPIPKEPETFKGYYTPLKRISSDICLFGNKGSGKTIMMVYQMLRTYLEGKQVFANFHSIIPSYYLDSIEQLESLSNGVFFADDIEAWLWSREAFSKKQKNILEIILNMGKRGVSTIWSSKRPMNCDLVLRDTTIWFIECRFMLKSKPISEPQFMYDIQFLDNYYVFGTVYDYLGQIFKYEILDDLPLYGTLYETKEEVKRIE